MAIGRLSTITSVIAAALLGQGQAQAQGTDVPMREATATASGTDVFLNRGVDPTVDRWEPVRGQVRLEVRDRVHHPRAPTGDEALFTAQFRSGVDRWTVELLQVGAPSGVSPSALGITAPLRGGAQLWPNVFGQSGMGPPGLAPARAAIALVGIGRVTHNGRVIEARTPVQVFALATGVHADDDTNRRLPVGRAGDAELVVYAPVVRSDLLPGYLLAVYENPDIEVMGRGVSSVAQVAVTEGQVAVGGAALGIGGVTQTPPPPDFEGAEADLDATVPTTLEAVPLARTAETVTARPASPLVDTPDPLIGGPLLDVTADVPGALDAVPLPQTVAPLNTTPQANGTPSLPTPQNVAPATPLPVGIPPANATPAAVP